MEKACEKKIQEAQAERATFERRVDILEQDLDAANAENARLTAESSSLVSPVCLFSSICHHFFYNLDLSVFTHFHLYCIVTNLSQRGCKISSVDLSRSMMKVDLVFIFVHDEIPQKKIILSL